MQALSLALLLLPPSLAQVDVPSQLEAIEFASSLDFVTEGLLQVDASADNLGALPKVTVSLDSVAVTDAALSGLVDFLGGITASLENQRDLVETTYLQPSSKKMCILPNLISESEQPVDFLFNPSYGGNISLETCEMKSPESEDTLSDEFFNWSPELMDILTPDSSLVWQYFGK